MTSFFVLGAVFLAVTGAEALYADMGHFGRAPIRLAWVFMVFPCLVLNYAGQSALVLNNPLVSDNTFYALCPRSLLARCHPCDRRNDHREPSHYNRSFLHDAAGHPTRLAAPDEDYQTSPLGYGRSILGW